MKRLLVFAALVACGPQPSRQPAGRFVVYPSDEAQERTAAQQRAAAQQQQQPSGPKAPVAQQRPFEIKSPNGTRNDPYYWLRDDTRKDAGVLAYLDAENQYAAAIMG